MIGFTVAEPCDELLMVRYVDALGKEEVVHVVKSCDLINVVPEEKR